MVIYNPWFINIVSKNLDKLIGCHPYNDETHQKTEDCLAVIQHAIDYYTDKTKNPLDKRMIDWYYKRISDLQTIQNYHIRQYNRFKEIK